MSRRNNIVLALAVLIALMTALAVRSRMSAPAPEVREQQQAATKILVVKNDVKPGDFVHSGQDLAWQSWPENNLKAAYIHQNAEQLSSFDGAVARRGLHAGEPVTPDMLVKPGAGGFLSAVLEPGMRAVAVPVSATTGAAGFIFPGDRVDLIVTHKVSYQTDQNNTETNVVSDTFVRDVRVVAVDQMLDNPENKAMIAKNVTLEVSPQQAERVAVADQLGTISLALRSLANGPQKAVEGQAASESAPLSTKTDTPAPVAGTDPTFAIDSQISPALNRRGDTLPQMLIIRGDSREHRAFYGDRP